MSEQPSLSTTIDELQEARDKIQSASLILESISAKDEKLKRSTKVAIGMSIFLVVVTSFNTFANYFAANYMIATMQVVLLIFAIFTIVRSRSIFRDIEERKQRIDTQHSLVENMQMLLDELYRLKIKYDGNK